MNKRVQPAMGHRLDVSEQGGEQMPMPVRCDARKGEAGRRCCRTHSGVPRNSKSLLETCTGKLWSRKGRGNRERSSETGSATLRPLYARSLSSSSASSLYRSRTSRSALNACLPYLTLFNPPRYLIRPFVQLGAHVREESVPTPWCPIPPLDGFLHDNVPSLPPPHFFLRISSYLSVFYYIQRHKCLNTL